MNTIGTECCGRQVTDSRAGKCDTADKRARAWELILVGPAVEEARHVFEGERA
jgi:hypothetical protein